MKIQKRIISKTDFTKTDSLIVKGFAIILLLYCHVSAYSGKEQIPFLGDIVSNTGNVCVMLFGFITVFGLAKKMEEIKRQKVFKLILKRIIKLYASFWPSYFVCFILTIIFDLISDNSTIINSYGTGFEGLKHFIENVLGLSFINMDTIIIL